MMHSIAFLRIAFGGMLPGEVGKLLSNVASSIFLLQVGWEAVHHELSKSEKALVQVDLAKLETI
jgi:hypothetical protein